ncbi:GNAT family N-acetyltransferase [Bacillus dakarensis]|uniref:GNAT family N-acetyltransferase n=1 Tax=Robertmurraya dakarensis TaxID=1926278 RepID=UPI0009FF8B22|nr:GNAT family N-acetyltransferase [Bacillus dakarensis]
MIEDLYDNIEIITIFGKGDKVSIHKINITSCKEAGEVLKIQIPAYRVEAKIIGYSDLPPLRETVDSLQKSGETFFGFYEKDELCGVISYKKENDVIDIHRLFVHPNHFRKGIAQKLLNCIQQQAGITVLKVSTGSKNAPAIAFYGKNGFEKVNEMSVNSDLTLPFFEKALT